MKQSIFTITENRKLAEGIYRMQFSGDVSEISAAGQFVNIRLNGHFLRRPISICDVGEDSFTIIYKVLGHGTEEMTQLPCGTELDILTGLGNGYDLSKAGDRPLLIGGGVGIPPMYLAARKLIGSGKQVTVILGFNGQSDVFYVDEFIALGCDVIATFAKGDLPEIDNVKTVKGFVTDAMPEVDHSYFYCCGPEAMLKAVYKASSTSGQFSFEERMGCGFGACMGCSCRTFTGYKRICKDGPVLEKEEILW